MIKLNPKTNKTNVIKLINTEITSINASIDFQNAFSKQILTFLKGFIGGIEVNCIFSDEINKFLADSSNYLQKINHNISSYNNLLDILDNIKFNCPTLDYNITVNKITQYNKKLSSISEEVSKNNGEIEKFVQSMAFLDVSEYISINNLEKVESENTESEEKKEKPKRKSTRKKSSVALMENTLTISETSGLVTLPYKISDLKKILRAEPEKYSSLSDVILSKYTVPIKNYKMSAVARFKEAYKLMIEKEKSSKKDACNLALELFSNYNLHPAIITACKNLNELDVYLSCLEFNELEDFHFFKIVYEVPPSKVKKSRQKKIEKKDENI